MLEYNSLQSVLRCSCQEHSHFAPPSMLSAYVNMSRRLYVGDLWRVFLSSELCNGHMLPFVWLLQQMEGRHNTHPASFLLEFVHRSICDTEPIQLWARIPVLVLEAVNAALYELHVILSESARLVCEDILDLQAMWYKYMRLQTHKHSVAHLAGPNKKIRQLLP